VSPVVFAILHASRQIAAELSLSAGVIPVKWKNFASWKIFFQLKSVGIASAIAECVRS